MRAGSRSRRAHFEHAFREDEPAELGLRLEDLKISPACIPVAPPTVRSLAIWVSLDAHVLQIGDVELLALSGGAAGFGGSGFTASGWRFWLRRFGSGVDLGGVETRPARCCCRLAGAGRLGLLGMRLLNMSAEVE